MAGLPLFVVRPVTCPVCFHKGHSRYPDPKLYHAAHRESDLHVLKYNWSIPGGEGILPHHYDVWQCPKCFYTDFVTNAEKPGGTVKDHNVRLAWKQAPDAIRKAVEGLRSLITEKNLTPDGAFALHAAGLLIMSLPDSKFINHAKVGRMAHKLAWLYRERKSGINTEQLEERSKVDDLRDCVERLDSQLVATATALDATEIAAIARAKDPQHEAEGEEENGEVNPYLAVSASMGDKLREMQTLLTMLHTSVLQDEQQVIAQVTEEGAPGLGQLEQILIQVRSAWSKFPLSEEKSLRMAVESLEFSYANENTNQSIEQSLTTLGLILDLLIRIGENTKALRFIAEIYNTGMEQKRELNRRVQEGKRRKRLSAHDEKMLARKIGVVHMSIQQAGENRRKILDMLFKKHEKTINKVLEKHSYSSHDDQVNALKKAGVPVDLMTYLKARKMLAPKDSRI